MKRLTNFLLAASAVLALASCEKFATMNSSTPDNGEIRFGTTGIRVETKAFSETTADTLEHQGFNVAAVIDAESKAMFNKAVAYESATGLYTVPNEHYYYPNTGTMSFYAAYPLTPAITIGEDDGAASLIYSHTSADIDLVAAKAMAVAKQPTAVMLTFDHLLSQIDVTAKGENATVDYKLKNVTVTAPDGGTYTYADDKWALSTTSGQYDVYRTVSPADDMTVSTGETATTVGGAMTFLPDDVSINVVWECFNKVDKTLISSNDQTISVGLIRGKHSTLNLILPSNASEIKFTIDVNPWTTESLDITVQPAASYTVDAAASETVTLPVFDMADNTKGYVNWGDGTVEHFDNEGTKASSVSEGKLTLSHEYAAAFDGSAHIFVETGSISAKIQQNELAKFTVFNSEKVSVDKPNLLTGKFTVCAEPLKKVKFAKGNLFWDGTKFKFEKHQYDYPTVWDVNHVGYFKWGSVAAEVVTDDSSAPTKGTFFAADGGAFEGFTVLSDAEWSYLIAHSVEGGSNAKQVTVDGKNCVILKPDGFGENVADSYTAEEWVAAEASGLVALPFAGYHNQTGFMNAGSYGYYWSSVPLGDYSAYRAHFSSGDANMGNEWDVCGYSVRPVQVVDQTE